MPEINGVRVDFREHFPAREYWELPAQLLKLSRMQLMGEGVDRETTFTVLTRVIESWDHPGDPADEAAYDDFDILGDILPMIHCAIELVNRRFGRVETTEEKVERLAAEAAAEAEAEAKSAAGQVVQVNADKPQPRP